MYARIYKASAASAAAPTKPAAAPRREAAPGKSEDEGEGALVGLVAFPLAVGAADTEDRLETTLETMLEMSAEEVA